MRKSRLVATLAVLAAGFTLAAVVPQAGAVVPRAGATTRSLSSTGTPYVNVMPLGDSITWGYTVKYGKPVVVDGYRKDLWVRLRNVGMNVNFVGSCPRPSWDRWKCNGGGTMGDNNHEGHSGYRIDQLSANVGRWAATYQPQIVLLMAGTNDIAQNYDLRRAPARLSTMIDRIRAVRPTAHIFVATIPQFRDPARKSTVDAYNNAIPGVVKSKDSRVHLVPQHLVGTQAKDFSDHVHPSDCGYAKLSFVWYYTMERHLARSDWPTGYYPWNNTGVCA
ncbi:MAG: SGNH/GDSL hydrolase family protein [Micromonosporaceae bacterium]